ncbi:lon protease-like protein, mitochondrial [Rozella allomycis CSF55]|uniref:Lon protease homolog n=1 Tax=Rozella allomycis (strain CSF55) TaxID=988480 RepID=A0A4P9YEP0_ROZAC|nr:lon protease-like protein, mitochondrial [Rozella allomycis CSF55]
MLLTGLNKRCIHTTIPNFKGLFSRIRKAATISESEVEDVPAEPSTGLSRLTIPQLLPELISIPVTKRPLFPSFYKSFSVKDQNVADAIQKTIQKGQPYIGLFLRKTVFKDENAKMEEVLRTRENVEENSALKSETIKTINEVYRFGVLAQVVNVAKTEDATGLHTIIYPRRRIRLYALVSKARVETLKDEKFDKENGVVKALTNEIYSGLSEIARMNGFFREHIANLQLTANVFDNPAQLADFVAVLVSAEPEELQEVLESLVIEERLRKALVLLKKELVNARLQNSISKDIEQRINQRQREYYLMEQMKSIKKELGLESDGKEKVIENFKEKAKELKMPEQAAKVFNEEISKLNVLEPSGAEFNITRSYIEWLVSLPWGKQKEEILNVAKAGVILDEDHYGLKDVKKRILEFVAVGRLNQGVQGKIICLVGPPGVGKTSIGRSIARALNRDFFRFSVGGLSDVAELKGHRRTYVGAMPGKLIQALKRVQSENPLILIDEVDKLGKGHQGDPASALLEVLDPEQNNSFVDHYLDVPVDLSKVLFVLTANDQSLIPEPLQDRMEIINLSGYVQEEKVEIAKQYLIPKALKESGLSKDEIEFSDSALNDLIRWYCRENGVRSLKKKIEQIFRRAALKKVENSEKIENEKSELLDENVKTEIVPENLKDFIGQPIYTSDRLYETTPPGIVMGLAWTSNGGAAFFVETLIDPSDKPQIQTTGQLGKVMEESVEIAYSFAKSFIASKFPENDFFKKHAIHLHVPEGAMPKDGPSAGITMTSALVSLALNQSINQGIAMTGEITLTGKVLAIGGLKEKTIAAKRAGANTIICPKANLNAWSELPDYIKKDVNIHFVDHFSQVYDIIFNKQE